MGDEHPDGYSSTRNFHIYNARVRTMIGSRPDGWSWIGNFLLWWKRVRTTVVRRPDGDIWIAILALRRRTSRRDTTSSGWLIDLPFLGTWKEIWNWSSTERRPDVLLKRPDGDIWIAILALRRRTSGRWYLNCNSCLKETHVRTGYHIVQMVDRSSLSWNLERNLKLIEYWEASGRAAETSGRMQAG
jgi:hypothetical protein